MTDIYNNDVFDAHKYTMECVLSRWELRYSKQHSNIVSKYQYRNHTICIYYTLRIIQLRY